MQESHMGIGNFKIGLKTKNKLNFRACKNCSFSHFRGWQWFTNSFLDTKVPFPISQFLRSVNNKVSEFFFLWPCLTFSCLELVVNHSILSLSLVTFIEAQPCSHMYISSKKENNLFYSYFVIELHDRNKQ